MCGLNGLYAYRAPVVLSQKELITTRDAMRARGPDGFGEWWDSEGRIGLGHRRLSILDLSDRASQPMVSACGRYAIVFNGEIYSYPELRRRLEQAGALFRTTSDTEALLHLFAQKNQEMVHELRGMYAFGIYDTEARRLFLARDPYGIKPLYTADDGKTFRFASQVKALLAGGGVSSEMDPVGIVGFHLWGSVPEPFTLYRQIRSLPPGHTQIIDLNGVQEPREFCSIARTIASARAAPAVDVDAAVRSAVLASVNAHLLADVEVGLFLSAGIDSGALLGLMRDAGQHRIRAITLRFDEFAGTQEDETIRAREVAELYGAEHVVRTVTAEEFQSELPRIFDAMDQPSIDGVNTYFVAKAAHEAGLKVALSGLGGDELFAGYSSFVDVPRWASLLHWPAKIPAMRSTSRLLLSASGLTRRYPKAAGLFDYGGTYAGAYFLRRALFLPFELNAVLDPDVVRAGLRALDLPHRLEGASPTANCHPVARVSALESSNYLRHTLLRDSDWAGMAHSLEIRTPLVDIELLRELSPLMPQFGGGGGKRALARAPSTPLPQSIVERPKTGFSVPTGQWASAANVLTRRSSGAASRAWTTEVLQHWTGAPVKQSADTLEQA